MIVYNYCYTRCREGFALMICVLGLRVLSEYGDSEGRVSGLESEVDM